MKLELEHVLSKIFKLQLSNLQLILGFSRNVIIFNHVKRELIVLNLFLIDFQKIHQKITVSSQNRLIKKYY